MRVRTICLTLGLAAPSLFGCGDDVAATPDAKVEIDAPVTPDAPPAPVFKGFDADEGGEIRMEYVRFAGGNAALRLTNFLFKDPGSVNFYPFPSFTGCTDMSVDMNWPTASNPIAERVYMNPGNVIISGGPSVINLPRRNTMGNDPFGRTHPADQWGFHFGGAAATDGATYLSEKTAYDVVFTGSADMPAQVFDDVIYMPADFTLTDHGVTPYALVAGQPATFSWTNPAQGAPAGVEIWSLLGFTGANGPAVVCIEKNDGSTTIPANMVDIVRAKYPSGGTLARQTFTHVVRELVDKNGPTGKRIDFVGVWCYATGFTVP